MEPPPHIDKGEEIPETQEDLQALLVHHQELIEKGAVEKAPSQIPAGCIFKMFLVEKRDANERRPVVNMRPLSPYVHSPHFKMEGLAAAKELIEKGDWFARLDLKDAYLHVPLHPSIRHWFRYRMQGVIFQWKSLPFGFRDAPRMFQKLMVVALTPLRQQGVRLVIYLDDILLISSSEESCLEETRRLVERLLLLGFVINLGKSELVPSRQKIFLGAYLDSVEMQLSLPRGKLKAFQQRIRAMLRKASQGQVATLKEIQSLVGTIVSMSDCVLAVRLRLNALMEVQNQALHSKGGRARLSERAVQDLNWWLTNLKLWNGRSIIPPTVDVTFDVDASEKGLGAILLGERESDVLKAHRFFKEGDTTHINYRELLAAEYGLQAFTKLLGWKGMSVRIRTDNVVAMAYINKMGGRIPGLSRIAERLHHFALSHQLLVSAEWIPSEENRADKESRIEGDLTDWELNPKAFALVERRFGKMDLDLFASSQNALAPRFVSLKADPDAYYVDAFSRPLPKDLKVFANPPFILIPRLLAKVRGERALLFLLAPVWPSQPWWPLLTRMMIPPPPLLLPRSHDLYLPPRGPLSQQAPFRPKWDTIVCCVSGKDSRGRVSTKQSSTW